MCHGHRACKHAENGQFAQASTKADTNTCNDPLRAKRALSPGSTSPKQQGSALNASSLSPGTIAGKRHASGAEGCKKGCCVIVLGSR